MGAEDPVRLVRPGDRRAGDPTPGMVREEAIAAAPLWAGLTRTAAGVASGWHHHGEHETSIYVAECSVRLEFGPGGAGVVEAGPGVFVLVPAGAVHRELNPGAVESHLVVVRAGTGPTTVNVEGPAPTPG